MQNIILQIAGVANKNALFVTLECKYIKTCNFFIVKYKLELYFSQGAFIHNTQSAPIHRLLFGQRAELLIRNPCAP